MAKYKKTSKKKGGYKGDPAGHSRNARGIKKRHARPYAPGSTYPFYGSEGN